MRINSIVWACIFVFSFGINVNAYQWIIEQKHPISEALYYIMECMVTKNLTPVECNRLRKLKKHNHHGRPINQDEYNENEKKIYQLMVDTKTKIIPIAIGVGAAIVLLVALVASSLKKLNSDEIGLKYDNIGKQLGDDAKTEGLHAGPPGFSFIIFPSVYQTLKFEDITCLNRDGVIIELDVSYQFRANPNYLRALVEQFKDFSGYKDVLLASGKSAVHDSCANFNTNDFQTSRGKYQENLRDIMRKYCESLYCELYELQVNNVQRPIQFETAVKEKEAAKENIRVAETERPRLILQAETEYEQAKKQAEIILNNAMTEAAIITNKAESEARALVLQYKKDLDVYKRLKDTQGLDNEALLSYLAVKAIGKSKEEINVAMRSPARTSYTSITD